MMIMHGHTTECGDTGRTNKCDITRTVEVIGEEGILFYRIDRLSFSGVPGEKHKYVFHCPKRKEGCNKNI